MTVYRGAISVAGLALMISLTSCGDSSAPTGAVPAPRLQDVPAQVVELSRFERTSYTSLDGRSAIALVTPNELELTRDGKTYSCQYTRDGNRIRLALEAAGTKTVEYYNQSQDGLVADNGARYYAPLALELAKLQAHGDDLKRQQSDLEAKILANKNADAQTARHQLEELKRVKLELSEKIEQEKRIRATADAAQAHALARQQPDPFQAQPRAGNALPVDYVLQAEECLGNNDRAGAIRFYDQAIGLTENDGNPRQARIFAARKNLIEQGKR